MEKEPGLIQEYTIYMKFCWVYLIVFDLENYFGA